MRNKASKRPAEQVRPPWDMGAMAPPRIAGRRRDSARLLEGGRSGPDAECGGKLYAERDPGVLVRVKGQAPIAATVGV